MRGTEGYPGRPRAGAGGHETALDFVAFALAHAGCAGGLEEARLDESTLACRCPRCDEVRIFGPSEKASEHAIPEEADVAEDEAR